MGVLLNGVHVDLDNYVAVNRSETAIALVDSNNFITAIECDTEENCTNVWNWLMKILQENYLNENK